MILELLKHDYKKILPLFLREEICFPLILAVLQQKQPGWVFVDDLSHPTSAMVVTSFGFMKLAGNDNFGTDILRFFESPKISLPHYILWYSPSFRIQRILDKFSPEIVRKRERARFIFKNQPGEKIAECPVGFEYHRLDKDLIKKTEHFKLEIGSRFWPSINDFLDNGIGTCIMKDGEIVSICYSACIVSNLAEIDVVTQEKYRGMGLAVVAAQNFISECMRRGITPTWDCFVNNEASMKLANHLGFIQTVRYPFYTFNIPADFGQTN